MVGDKMRVRMVTCFALVWTGCLQIGDPTVLENTGPGSELETEIEQERDYVLLQDISTAPATDVRHFLGPCDDILCDVPPPPLGAGWRSEYQDVVAQILEDTLVMRVGYSGGCEDHEFTLYAARSSERDNAALLYLHHDGNGDSCDAWLVEWLRFDVGNIRQDMKLASPVVIESVPEVLPGSNVTPQETYVPFTLTY